MSQLNSEAISLSCDWQFKVEGDPFPSGGAGLPMGLAINPGHFITSAFYNIMEPITTTGNPAVDTVRIFFWIDFLGTTLVMADTIANLNALFLNTWQTGIKAPNYALANTTAVQNPNAMAAPGVYQIRISSSAPLTGGRIATVWNVTQLQIK